MDNFVQTSEQNDPYCIGYEVFLEPASGTKRVEWQVRSPDRRQVFAVETTESKIKQRLDELLTQYRVEVVTSTTVGRAGWSVKKIQVKNGHGAIIETFFAVYEGSRRLAGTFATQDEAEVYMNNMMIPPHQPRSGGMSPH